MHWRWQLYASNRWISAFQNRFCSHVVQNPCPLVNVFKLFSVASLSLVKSLSFCKRVCVAFWLVRPHTHPYTHTHTHTHNRILVLTRWFQQGTLLSSLQTLLLIPICWYFMHRGLYLNSNVEKVLWRWFSRALAYLGNEKYDLALTDCSKVLLGWREGRFLL